MHLYKENKSQFIIISILLFIGGFFHCAEAKTFKDKFIFKVETEVFTLKDIREYKSYLSTLKCIYPETLLFSVFKSEFEAVTESILKFDTNFSAAQKSAFIGLKGFGKILIYSKSYDVAMNEQLAKFFLLSAKESKCDLSVFDAKKQFVPRFKEIVHLEVFIRKRFLPTESEGKTTKQDITKAVQGVKDLIKSIDPQIDEEVYW